MTCNGERVVRCLVYLQVFRPSLVVSTVRRPLLSPDLMHYKRILAVTFALVVGFAVLTPTLVHYLGVGHAPQHLDARVAWWKAPNQIGATIGLTLPSWPSTGLHVEYDRWTFGNDRNTTAASWRFLRNSGNNDVYQFRIRIDQQPWISRTVYFYGSQATVIDDVASGTSVTIESEAPFERSGGDESSDSTQRQWLRFRIESICRRHPLAPNRSA